MQNLAYAARALTRTTAPSSPWSARLDVAQSFSGLFLGLFMWLHMLFVASILVSEDAFWTVARFFEGYFFFGRPYPILVSFFVAFVFGLFVLHAWLALRKFPTHWRQHSQYWRHMRAMRHEDTTLWFVQVITGFGMFFLASVHLYTMMAHPELIGPYESADRVWTGRFWPLYLVLLFLVELHGGIGLYRLAVKWGWPAGRDPERTRRLLKRLKWGLTVFYLVLGLLSLAAYVKLGIAHAPHAGEPYLPTWQTGMAASNMSVPSPPTPAPRPTAGAASPAGCEGGEPCFPNSPLAPLAGEGSTMRHPATFTGRPAP
ncbi:MAG TPA: fumarate reductase cytochrome b subunit [Thiobacillaceae bacterium]|nr:fumarate reductase cytochrome b subunit [Thiobacillaceae bacterium]